MNIAPAAQSSELSACTDAELIGRIAELGASGRAEQSEFYQRHARYLYSVLKRQCAGALARSQQEVEDLVQDTFRRAFERAETFRSDEHVDSDQLRRRCRAWLGRIAKNLLADALNRIREASTLDALLERPSEPERQPEEPSALLAHVEEVIQSLSEREQDVIRVFCLYYRPGEVNQRLPNAVSAELASRWRTTPDHIRVIRSRALQRIKAHVMDNWTREKEVSA